jgi:hypothetical protein
MRDAGLSAGRDPLTAVSIGLATLPTREGPRRRQEPIKRRLVAGGGALDLRQLVNDLLGGLAAPNELGESIDDLSLHPSGSPTLPGIKCIQTLLTRALERQFSAGF